MMNKDINGGELTCSFKEEMSSLSCSAMSVLPAIFLRERERSKWNEEEGQLQKREMKPLAGIRMHGYI